MKKNQSGQIIVLAIVVAGLVLVNTLVIIAGSQVFSQNANYSVQADQAINLAEAGVDKAVASLNASGGSYSGETETFLGPGSFSVNVTTPDSKTKIIESTGYVPSKADAKTKRTVKVTASKGVGVAFNYGVQVGDGGLLMSQNSTVNGSVYANGNIEISNNARITGDAYVAGGTAPIPDQSGDCVSPNCTDFIFGKTVGGNNQLDVAQSFKPADDSVLNKVALKLKKFGSPSDLNVKLLRNDAGQPDKNRVIASGTLTSNLVTSQYGFIDVAFISPPVVSANTTYWIMIDTTADSGNYWAWSADSIQGYTQGSAKWSPNWQAGNAVWNTISADLGFQTYMGGETTYIQGQNGANIDGNAHANTLRDLTIGQGAYYQAASNITAGSSHPGEPDPAVKVMPISDANITAWQNEAADPTKGGGVYNGDISSCVSTLGPGKYVGNVTFSNNCVVTVKNPVWITGNLTLGNSNTLRLDASYGASSGVIIVDGIVNLANNNSLRGSGTDGSYLLALSTYDSTIDGVYAITVSNSGNQGAFYAGKGIVEIQNTNYLSEVTAWKLRLSNGVTINYESGLASSFFTSGPSGSYSLLKGTYQLK